MVIGCETNLVAGILVAQLALKHRQDKKQQQIIIIFAGSPLKYDKQALEIIGHKLKKNNVALDIIDFGEEDDGKAENLEALVTAANNNGNGHGIHVPPGPNVLSDVLISTLIFTGNDEGGSQVVASAVTTGAGGVTGFEFGVDPNLDLELALALRISLEEERARQEAPVVMAAEEAVWQEKGRDAQSSTEDATMTENTNASGEDGSDDLKSCSSYSAS